MKLSRWLWRSSASQRIGSLALVAAPLITGGCNGFGEAMTAHTDIVARAAGKELKVEEASQLLATNPQIPADPQVVRALTDIWVDYILLATAVAEDSTLSSVDLDAFTEPAREQAIMMRLREQVIQPDTTFTDEELSERWTTDGPGVEVRARHILLRAPAEATPAQRDSVRQLAESLRQQAVEGADFAELAREHSQDPGSAQRGGDLGFFGRGRMVAPFEEAAFALEPGKISQVVESPFGYHVIKVEERRQPELGEERENFRQFLVQQAHQEAETEFLDSLATAAGVEVKQGGLEVVREIATRPELSLRGRAARREIATYQGGEFTAGEFAEFIRTQAPQTQSAFSSATDEQLETAVQQLVRKELLLQQAEERNISLSEAQRDSLHASARDAIRNLLQASGLSQLGGRRVSAAELEAQVTELLEGAIQGRSQLVPLGRLGFILRDLYPNEINEGTFPQVISQLEEIRASQAPQQGAPEGTPQQPAEQSDTAQPASH